MVVASKSAMCSNVQNEITRIENSTLLIFYIRILFFRLRMNIIIFTLSLGCKYVCENSYTTRPYDISGSEGI